MKKDEKYIIAQIKEKQSRFKNSNTQNNSSQTSFDISKSFSQGMNYQQMVKAFANETNDSLTRVL